MKKRMKRWRDGPLWRDILLVLLIKSVMLYGLWKAFFSHPLAEHMTVPQSVVESHLTAGSGSGNEGGSHVARP
ncbi:cytochrome oxidase putative small subunit CydP [Paludibacterium paludis]|uniref:Uncharacterized protein n=1 Tax=Paludibacterium paludis TaxID=1225769 RepID=A0A918P4A3_9NEIS|nr:cytochrome oxidase putative small subunit CydP [Paludibacterium paludis]GGY20568.1 hypothetical protein GCM10011289_25210 [Paludibacterium paludis]